MKIVYCIPMLYNTGGMERVLTQKANYLASHTDWNITIITTETPPIGAACCYFPLDERVTVVEMGIDFGADFASNLLVKTMQHIRKQRLYKQRLIAWLKKEKVDVCVSLCGKEIEWLGHADIPCRKVAELHFAMDYRKQLLMQYHHGFFWNWIGNIKTWQLRHCCKAMDALVVLTKADAQRWREEGIKQVISIPNPCSMTPTLSGGHDKKQVLAVGRLHPQKGFDLLLQAWKIVAAQYPDWILKIVGEGSQRPLLEHLIDQLNLDHHVQMNGLSDCIQQDYEDSRVLALSSRYEGYPLAIVEAMSCGLPVVAFDCPEGPSELVQNNETGYLVANGDIKALADKLMYLMHNKKICLEMGEKAYQYALQHFAVDEIMSQWITLFTR